MVGGTCDSDAIFNSSTCVVVGYRLDSSDTAAASELADGGFAWRGVAVSAWHRWQWWGRKYYGTDVVSWKFAVASGIGASESLTLSTTSEDWGEVRRHGSAAEGG